MEVSIVEKLKSKTSAKESGCWEWSGAVGGNGYGNTYLKGKYLNSHRAMWAATYGDIPVGQFVLHRCDNRLCINPAHLFLGTQKENMFDMTEKDRRSNSKNHAEAIQKGWTPELRAARAEQTREREQKKHQTRASSAGVPSDWKFCPECAQWHPRQNFYRNKARRDGLKPYCKPCSIKIDMARRVTKDRQAPRPKPGN